MKRKHFILVLVAMLWSFSLSAQEQLLVNYEYNSSTEGYGTTKFSNYAGAYAYATANSKTSATIVIEKTNTLSGNTFDNNHKSYSKLAVVIKDGATMGNAASKWDMTYPVTVEPGGTLTCARPKNSSVSNIHIKNKLIVGAKGATKKAYVNFLSDEYQDCDISIRYNGSIEVYNADFYVQDLDAQGKLTIEDSEVEVDGAFASATSFLYPTTLTNSTITINGNQISGGLSDFSGGTSNQLGNVKINNSTLTIKEGDTKVAANVTATNSTIAVNNLTVNSGKTLNLNEGSTLDAEKITGTGSVKIDGVQAPIVDGAICVPVSDFAALKSAVEAGKNVQLTTDITTTSAIKTSGVTSVIDLNGNKLTIGAGDNKFNDESNITIKNGTVSITGVTVGGNAIFCLDEYEKLLVTTVTLDNVNLVGEGYSSAYGIFYIGESSVLNVNGGEWNLKNDTHESGGVFKADGSGAKLNIDGLKLTAHNVRRVVTYAATTVENSTMDISGDADGVDAQMEHGFNRSPLAINNSTITMKDMVGRGITAQNGAVTISANSKVEMTNCQEATIDVRNNQTVTIDNTSTVSVDKKPTVASGSAINGTVKLPTVAKIGDVEYSDIQDALEATKTMTGDVTVELYDKVTFNQPLIGNYTSINFVGKDTDAEMYLDVQGYTTATGKKVSFTDLKLSKSEGGFIANAGFMNVAFGIYDVVEVTYNNCTFLNGACASSGKVTFNGCTFKKSWDKYGLWAYGNVDVTVQGSTFADYRGIKMYAENGAAASVEKANLTVKNTNFSAVDNKPAIVLTYGESVVLEGNTYSSTGTFELDLDGKPNGVAVTSDVAPVCVNDNGACGVLVDGKIYTTVAQAAEVATETSTVTLLHSSDETVEFPMGTTIEKNGFTADNVTTAQPFAEYVVLPISMTVNNYKALFGTNTVTDGTNYYATLQAAVEAVAKNAGVTRQANAVLYCKPGADVGSLQHAPVVSTLTIYGNGANVTGGSERDFDLGNTDPSGGRDITADMTLTVKHLNGCGAWGAKATEHTVNLVFENCANMGKVFISGTTGTLNITMNDCAFEGVLKEAVYSNADGAITLNNVAFSNLNKAINLNHKAAGTQTVTINGCSFTNCGADVAADQIPVRVLSSVDGGKTVLNVSNATFTGTPEGGADILLDYGVGETTASVTATAANVFVEKENNVATKTTVTESEGGEFTNAVPVAKVNGIEYMTLADAVAAVEDGGTITLIANETFTKNNRFNNGGWWDGLGYSGDKSFTIDLAGFTISQNGALNDYLMWFKNDGAKDNTITLKNGTLDAGTTAYCALATASSNAKKITVNLENIKLINNNSNGATLKIRGGAELNANVGTIITGQNSYLGIEAVGKTTVVNIYEGAEIYQNGTSSYCGCLAGVSGNGTINVYGGEGQSKSGGFIAMTSGGTINIEGGEWTANTDGTYANSNKSVLVAQSENGAKSIVNVTGGTFKGGYNCYGAAVGDAQINIKGGNFNADPKNYVAEDYIAVKNNDVWNVVKAAAKVGEQKYATLQEAFKAATSGCTIDILSDVTVDYNWDARYTGGKFTVPVTINGDGKTIKFTASVNDNNYQAPFRFEADATVKNLTIDMSEVTDNRFRAISSKGNLTVDGCKFIGKDATLNCRAIIFGEGAGANVGNLAISVTNSEFINWKRGITDNENGQDVKTATITGNTLENAAVYVSAYENVTFTGNTVAGAYVNIKSYTAGNKLAVTATGNTLEANTETAYNVINAGGKVEAEEGFNVVAKGGSIIGYTSTEGIWGEVWGNARNSFVIKVLDANDNVMGTTSLNNIGGIIDGDVNVSWNIKFNAAANTDEYWTMSWTTAPSINNMPAKVQLWVDGTKVSEGNVVLNGPDNLWPIAVAVTDENGVIKSCAQTLEAAVAAGNNVAILKAGTYALKVKDGLTITGAVEGVEFANIGAFGCNGANVTFNNVTFTYAENSTYKGLQHSGNLVYNNCTFNGQVFLYGASETFNKCTFNTTDSNNYNVWTYGAKEVAFNECTFNSAGKSVLIYNESASVTNNVTVTKSQFIASQAVEGKAAIEMDSSLSGAISLTIDGETTATGFGTGNVSGNSLWNNKKGNNDLANNDITVKVGNTVVLAPIFEAQIGDVQYRNLQDAIDAVQNGETITVLRDIATNVEIKEKDNVKVTIDGNGMKMTGTIKVVALSSDNDRRITIKNFKFEDATSASVDFITSVETNHYPRITVEGCTFTGSGDATDVALRLKSSNNVEIKNCTSKGLHSFLQNTSGWNLTIENVTVTESKSGLALGTVQGVTVKGCDITAAGYGIRMDAGYNNNAVIESNTIEAFIPVVVRKATVNSNIAVNGTNNLTATNSDGIWCAIGTSEYEANGVMPTAATGNVVVALNDADLDSKGIYGNALAGQGTAEAPYLINNIGELVLFRNSVNAGETKYSAPGVHVALGADIDMTGINWVGIGSMTAEHGFMGNFDGKGFKIKNLTIDNPALDSDGYAYAGLFALTEGIDKANQNFVKNLVIENVTINTTGKIAAAAIAYAYYTIVDNVKVCGNIAITGGDYTAGVLAYTRRCVNASNLAVAGNDGSYITGAQVIGGVISDIQMNGGLKAEYSNFSAEGVTVSGTKNVGGISGIIATQTLNGATVKNVTLNSDNAGVGIVAGCLGGTSTISNVTYENVAGASTLLGTTYDGGAIEAKIGDTYYATLDAALAAEGEATVELFVPVTVATGESRVIELNGKTVIGTDNATGSFALININPEAELTINGEGAIKLTATINRGWNAYSSVISNQRGKLTVNGGTIEHLGGTDMAYAIDNLTNTGAQNAETVINGGTVKSTYRAIRQFLNSTSAQNVLTVNGGTIEGANKSIWMQGANANANPGALTVAAAAAIKGDVYLTTAAGTAEYPVVVAVAADALKDGAQVLTSNVPADFAVANVNGTWTKVDAAASLNGKGYATLRAAVEAAQNGETVELLANVTLAGGYEDATEGLRIEREITLNGNGHTIDCGNFQKGIRIYNLGTDGDFQVNFNNVEVVNNVANGRCIDTRSHDINLTITDSKLIAQNGNSQPLTIGGSEAIQRVKLDDAIIDAGNSGYGVIAFVPVKQNIYAYDNTKVTGYAAFYLKDHGNANIKLSLGKGTYIGKNIHSGASNAFGTVVLEGDNNVLQILGTNPTLKAITEGNASQAVVLVIGANNKVSLESASAIIDIEGENAYYGMISAENAGTTTIINKGNTMFPVAEVGGFQFMTIKEAIRYAGNEGTIKVVNDFELAEAWTIPAGKKYTLDLNGKTVTYTSAVAGEDMITNRGNLTITDSSDAKTGKLAYVNTDNTASNVTVSTISTEAGSTLVVDGGTIENKTVKADGSSIYSYAIDILTNGNLGDVNVTINGGTVYSDYMAIRQFNNGTACKNSLTINGGYIYGAKRAVQVHIDNNAAVTAIKGGKVEAGEGGYAICNFAATSDLAVTGGEFIGAVYSARENFISGGIYDAEVYAGYCAEGYMPNKNTDGTYGVVLAQNVVASLNGFGYATLAEAIKACVAGDNTIELLADCAEKVTITQVNGTNIVINGNGKNYTGTITVKGDKVPNNHNTETLTFNNINFAPAYNTYAITAEKNTYARNITVDGCTFKGNNDVYGIRVRNGYNYTVKNTTAEGVYTFLNASEALVGLTVENVTVKCANVAFAAAYGMRDASFKNVIVESDNNGVKVNNPNSSALTFENCSITAKTPVSFIENAGVTSALTAEFTGTNTMVVNNGGTYWFDIVEADATDATFKAIVNDANLDMSNTAFAASVGNVYYSSLQKAIDAAVDGDVVTLAKDIELDAANCVTNSGGYSVFVNVAGKAVTFDLNGKAITANLSADQFASAKSKLLLAVFAVDTNGNLTLNDSEGTGKVAVTANDASVYSLISNYDKSAKLTINGGSYELDVVRAQCSLIHSDPSEAVVVNGGNFYLGNVNTGANGSPWIFNVNGNNTGHVIVNGGTFNYDINHQYWAFEVHVDKTSALKDNGNGTWTVVPAIAYVTEENNGYTREAGCASLADAFASKYGNEVTMVADAALTETVVVPAGKEVVLDLNGKTISAAITEQLTKSFAAIQNKGTLTVKDASTDADGKISVSYAGNSFGYGVGLYTISNEGGVLNIEGGTIENTTTVSGSMYDAIDNNSTLGETVLNISGGEVVCGQYIGVRQFANNTTYDNIVNVTGGKVVGGNTSIWMQNPGSNQPKATIAISGADYENGNYPVIKGRLLAGESTGFNFEVTGGLFDTDVRAFCAEKYAPYNFYNGTWGVEYLILDELTIDDDKYYDGILADFENQNEKSVGKLTYKRTLYDDKEWNALYVPFEIPVEKLTAMGLEVAYINDVRSYDKDMDGKIDDMTMEVFFINSGTLHANHPYLFRRKDGAVTDMELVVENTKLYTTADEEQTTITCSSAYMAFVVSGTYNEMTATELDGSLILGVNEEDKVGWIELDPRWPLSSFRLYLTITTKNGSPVKYEENVLRAIQIRVIGEGDADATFIKYYDYDAQGADYIYDLQGRRVLEPQKGNLYIINGKKVIF